MSRDVMARCDGLGKKYLIGHEGKSNGSRTLRDNVTRILRGYGRAATDILCGRPLIAGDTMEEFWALRQVTFEVQRGEVLGIIGRNGAGKSTLLKVLSRITEPTEGRIAIKGRVASLLEVGTGFHPELGGRENIYLNGAILGMTKSEIRRKFDEIVAFAGVERFLDTPVKRFSSGMYVRLAFAVAAHLDPEILIVDEVLAVGDAEFQQKCLGKMKQAAGAGRTVMFVSHNLRSVADLCTKVLLLDQGSVITEGSPSEVVMRYLSCGRDDSPEWSPARGRDTAFSFNTVRVAPKATTNGFKASFPYPEPLEIVFDYNVDGDIPPGRLAFKLVNEDGLTVLCSADTDGLISPKRAWLYGRTVERCTIPGRLLTPGRYHVIFSEPNSSGDDILHENCLSFKINEFGSPSERDGRRAVVTPVLQWETKGASL